MKKEIRPEFLVDNATRVEREQIRRDYSEEEMSLFKDEIAKTSIELSEKEDVLKELSKSYKDELKAMKKGLRLLLNNVKSGATYEMEDVYLIDDQEKGVMEYYDKNGVLFKQRRLTPQEKQTKLQITKTA